MNTIQRLTKETIRELDKVKAKAKLRTGKSLYYAGLIEKAVLAYDYGKEV